MIILVLLACIWAVGPSYAGPLHQAASSDDIEVVQALLSQGADVDKTDLEGRTALHWAAQEGNVHIVDLLVTHKARLNQKNKNGDTPLLLAAYTGQSAVVQQLIVAGADLDAKDDGGTTPLYWAIKNRYPAVAELLISKGADVNTGTDIGDTPLHVSARVGEEQIVELLLRNDAEPNTHDSYNKTPLHEAAREGHAAIAKLLLAAGAEVDARMHRGETALYEAARWGRTDIVEALLEHGADINASSYGGSPLHGAVLEGGPSVVELLIEKGADVNAKNNARQTPLVLARGNERLEAILLAAGARALEPRYQITLTDMGAILLSVMVLSVLALLPFSWRFGRPWGIGLTIAPTALYVVFEYLMSTRFLHAYTRGDLFVILPLLAVVIGNAVYRSIRPSHKQEGTGGVPVHGLAINNRTAGAPGPAQPLELPLQFHGSAREYFQIWIVNLCLILLTLGVFSAWAKVRRKRYFYSNITIDDTPFQYLGKPVPILKGRIVAVVLFAAYWFSSSFYLPALPWVLAAGALIAPWVIARSAAFNARYSAFRNMTFQFHGNYLGAAKTIYWLVPLPVVGMMFAVLGYPQEAFALSFLATVIAFPWWLNGVKRFIVSGTSYGNERGQYSASGSQFFRVYFIVGLILLGAVILTAIPIIAIIEYFPRASPDESDLSAILLSVPIYAAYVLASAYIQANIGNLVWNHTRLGPLCFNSTLRGGGFAKLYFTNTLGIFVSLGLLIPWAVMRTLKYRADNLRVLVDGELTALNGGAVSAVQATGAEVGEIFDLDLSL